MNNTVLCPPSTLYATILFKGNALSALVRYASSNWYNNN